MVSMFSLLPQRAETEAGSAIDSCLIAVGVRGCVAGKSSTGSRGGVSVVVERQCDSWL